MECERHGVWNVSVTECQRGVSAWSVSVECQRGVSAWSVSVTECGMSAWSVSGGLSVESDCRVHSDFRVCSAAMIYYLSLLMTFQMY